jgi:hypothetical protein
VIRPAELGAVERALVENLDHHRTSGDHAPLLLDALYDVCEDVDGTCLYRRQDIPLNLQVR